VRTCYLITVFNEVQCSIVLCGIVHVYCLLGMHICVSGGGCLFEILTLCVSLITHHSTTLHYTTLHYTTLHYTTLHYTTLHFTTLHYTTLHYTTLHHPPRHLNFKYCPPLNTALHYHILREHAMVAICNGMFAYGGCRPFCATFLNFIGYALGSVRYVQGGVCVCVCLFVCMCVCE
jgi:Transketolase, pyrimidine binding domain